MKTRIIVFTAVCLLVIIGALVAWQRSMQQKNTTNTTATTTAPTLVDDAYPLYPNVAWQEAYTASTTIGTSTVHGVEVDSEPIESITDLSSVSMPFENYYKNKLEALGWTVDQSLAANGPGAGVTGYTKANELMFVNYSSLFSNVATNSPETCPCTMTLSVFSGTK